jgi:hypothetical protein
MPCPDLGALRASLDDVPAGTPTAPPDHLRACPSCSDTLAELQRNAELAAPAIALTAPADPPSDAAVEAALARLEQRRDRLAAGGVVQPRTPVPGAPEREGSPPAEPVGRAVHSPSAPAAASAPGAAPDTDRAPVVPLGRRRRLGGIGVRARAVAAGLVAAAVLTGVVATPGGRAAAAGFLGQFRSQRLQVVSLDTGQLNQSANFVNALVDTGVFTGDTGEADRLVAKVEPARDPAAAGRLAGFAVPAVDPSVLPGGVRHRPERILVSPARTVRVTFDRDQALAYLRAHGRPDANLPERYDGARLVVHVPAAVVQQFAGRDGGPALIVGKAGLLAMDTEGGASLEELREVVLGLPGLPAGVAGKLRDVGDWRTTLPLPVPTDQVHAQPVTVAGAEGLGFADQSGRLHAVVWQRDGYLWGVAGVAGADQVRHVADSLG